MKKLVDQHHYTAIVCDFDGTLAGKDITINKPVVAAVRMWIESGRIFSIATGRQFNGVIRRSCALFGLETPQIVRNGAEIVDPKTGEVLVSTLMPDSDVARLVALLLEHKFAIWVEKDEAIYTPGGEIVKDYDPVPFKDLVELDLHKIPKIHIRPCDDPMKMRFVEETLVNMFPKLHFIRLHAKFGKSWDVTAADATKQMAVLRLAKLLDKPADAFIGIGDGYNDYALLSACGFKVAMGNAVEELKPLADMIAPSVSEDGVAAVIRRFLLQ